MTSGQHALVNRISLIPRPLRDAVTDGLYIALGKTYEDYSATDIEIVNATLDEMPFKAERQTNEIN